MDVCPGEKLQCPAERETTDRTERPSSSWAEGTGNNSDEQRDRQTENRYKHTEFLSQTFKDKIEKQAKGKDARD
jgi:hypothetical protein